MSLERTKRAQRISVQFGVRREAQRHAAIGEGDAGWKAVSPLRSATAVQNHSSDGAVAQVEVLRANRHAKPKSESDSLAVEEPLEIRVQGRSVAVTMRTPGHDRELAAGFLITEGIIRNRRDVIEILHCRAAAAPDNTMNVFLAPSLKVDFAQLTRHVFATSSCGLCGKASIESVHQHFPPVRSRVTVTAQTLRQLPKLMRQAQATFDQTGGLHAAAVFDTAGELIVLREDVGRHNAVDKVVGHGFLEEKWPFDSHILLVSGRASFEIMQKALAARIPIVCAVSAPSSLAVQFARESGQTLVGFLRGDTMNIYAGARRIRQEFMPRSRKR
ncbi:MAG: formate dehydrogenase accessory sulfurtransferase FdhD [Verrucomicrobia bacterium]|nr:formate dehydrogenase accessory sulfurtransferase FdhD [Verrucomicrobiota bacterium]